MSGERSGQRGGKGERKMVKIKKQKDKTTTSMALSRALEVTVILSPSTATELGFDCFLGRVACRQTDTGGC